MKNETNLTAIKQIAIVAPVSKRKELIEWSYFNKDMLAKHELISTSTTAKVLEGTVNKPVYKLSSENAGGYHQMAAMMLDNKVDVIFFFENPMKSRPQNDTIRRLLDIALEMNIVIAGERSSIDFMQVSA